MFHITKGIFLIKTSTFLFSNPFLIGMYIINATKKALLAKKAKARRNIFSQSIGLMFSIKPKALIFVFREEKIIPLHMFFVFYPIDVLFLNKNKNVVEIKENFKPFSFYKPKNKAQYFIELPKCSIKKTKTKVGDEIKFRKC
jgi:uncharacterized protein